jgi:hypothetical protein
LLTASVRAQESAPDTATPVQAKDGGVASDTVFELSPFEVSASKDNKYMPTNAASGTRIALPLESTPLAISYLGFAGSLSINKTRLLGPANLEEQAWLISR